MNKLYLFLCLIFVIGACETIMFDEELDSEDPQENFDYLWNEANEKYSYFEVKNIDWDSVYTAYAPRITQNMPEDSLFQVLGNMLKELRDDHTNLISDFDVSTYVVRYDGPDNFDYRIVTDNYLPRDYYISGPFQHDFILGSEEQIGYVRFPAFTGTTDDDNLDFVIDRYTDTEGLIVDLRENGGGASTDAFHILSRFVDERTLLFYSRIKNGPGRGDFTEAEPAYVKPHDGPRYTQSPVIFLVDRGTYSAGSFTSLATKAIPNITLMGDTTGGGLGLPNGGQLPNEWTYRFSVSQALDLNGDNQFERGVPPDIQASLDRSDLTTDEIIERAIQEIIN